MEVVEVEVKGGGSNRFVRISIDKPEGVTHADCELVSQQVGTILDVEDVVPGGHYTLEVSSPGRGTEAAQTSGLRALSGQEGQDHPARAGGRPAQLGRHAGRLRGRRRHAGNAAGKTIRFPFDQVQKANLKFEW